MVIEIVVRQFRFNGQLLPDPGVRFAPREVMEIHSRVHPALANAAVEGPELKGGKEIYTFAERVGKKG